MKGLSKVCIQKGSGILCVLLATGGLLTAMSLVIRYTTYGVDIAHQRVLCEQRYFALQGLLNYGRMYAEKSVVSDVLTMPVDKWLTHYTGKIVISAQSDMVNVHAYLNIASDKYIDAQMDIPKITSEA